MAFKIKRTFVNLNVKRAITLTNNLINEKGYTPKQAINETITIITKDGYSIKDIETFKIEMYRRYEQ